MFDKRKIKEKFSLASRSYNNYAGLQKEVAGELAKRLPAFSKNHKRVLDIGAGTGFLSTEILDKTPGLPITALDIAHGMSLIFRERHPGCFSVTGDIEFLPFSRGTFDTVVSSLSMQWTADFKGAFKEVIRVLKRGGYLAVALLGQGSFPELKESHNLFFDTSLYRTLFNTLPTVEKLQAVLDGYEHERFLVTATTKTEEYKNALLFLKRLKYIGAQNPFGDAAHKREYRKMKKMLSYYDTHFATGGGVQATYEILWIEGAR